MGIVGTLGAERAHLGVRAGLGSWPARFGGFAARSTSG
jgi:hypothetical protein